MKLTHNISIFQYVDSYEFAEWVADEFGLDKNNVRDRLIKNDYIEGSLGCRWSVTDDHHLNDEESKREIGEWYIKFLKTFNLTEIQLEY
jgi:hypothetical protein